MELTGLTVKNYGIFNDIRLNKLAKMIMVHGNNGTGKTTLIRLFQFLKNCFTDGLKETCCYNKLHTYDEQGPITIDIKYQEAGKASVYHLVIGEQNNRPIVQREWLTQDGMGHVLDNKAGVGRCRTSSGKWQKFKFSSDDTLAVPVYGRLVFNPQVSSFYAWVGSWYIVDNEDSYQRYEVVELLVQLERYYPDILLDIESKLVEMFPYMWVPLKDYSIAGAMDHATSGVLRAITCLLAISNPTIVGMLVVDSIDSCLDAGARNKLIQYFYKSNSQVITTSHYRLMWGVFTNVTLKELFYGCRHMRHPNVK